MYAVKSEQSERAGNPPIRVAMTTALLGLLLACQLPLATDDLASRFALGSDFSLLEAADPQLEYSGLELPDVILETGLQLQQSRRFDLETGSASTSNLAHFSFTDIRAPPALS